MFKSVVVSFVCFLFPCVLGNVLPQVSTCEDKVACKLYSNEICSDPQYFSWTQTNCPKFCGLCAPTTDHFGVGKVMDNSLGTAQCSDTITNCADYGTKICHDVRFYNWINENCRQYCNRCDTTCKDTIPNCSDYGADVCTTLSYYNWVEMHCRRYCARCT